MNIGVVSRRGTLALCGQMVNEIGLRHIHSVPQIAVENRIRRDGANDFHITILTSDEMDVMKYAGRDEILSEIDIPRNFDIHGLGVGSVGHEDCQTWFVVIYSHWLESKRREWGLPALDAHITLGFMNKDMHVPKGIETISVWSPIDVLTSLQNQICVSLQSSPRLYHVEVDVVRRCIYSWMESSESIDLSKFRAAGKWAMAHKEATLVEDIGNYLFSNGHMLGLKFTMSCALERQLKLFSDIIQPGLPAVMKRAPKEDATSTAKNLREINATLRDLNNPSLGPMAKNSKVLSLHLKSRALDMYPLPRNFTWLPMNRMSKYDRVLLAGCAKPSCEDQVYALFGVGIRTIITVHEEPLADTAVLEAAAACEIAIHHAFVVDRTPPTLEQLSELCEVMRAAVLREEGVVVHCQGGVGRTNTLLAAFLMKMHGTMSAADAIAHVTSHRKIILAVSQEKALRDWWTELSASGTALGWMGPPHALVPEATEAHTDKGSRDGDEQGEGRTSCGSDLGVAVEGPWAAPGAAPLIAFDEYRRFAQQSLNLPPLIMLCGFAASGKSTFSKSLVGACGQYFARVNKDDMRKKGECEGALYDGLRRAAGGNGAVVLDCCNLTVLKRKEWLDAAHRCRAWCLFFDVSIEECRYRIQRRENHPTIPAGKAGLTVLASMEKQMQPPAEREGFERLIRLECEEDVLSLLKEWRIPLVLPPSTSSASASGAHGDDDERLFKFPRTQHALNLGAATRDDKVASEADLALFIRNVRGHIIVEEKVDGANMGISIRKSDGKVVVQNRSHFVSSSYHAQFQPLDKWLAKHTADLWEILEPGRHILYGEWLYATHSVCYDRLPGWFIAYDIYDKAEEKFLARARVTALLSKTEIPQVPLLHEGRLGSTEELLALVHGPSAFSTVSPREGVVIRLCDPSTQTLVSRAKIVRSDFIAGNERWNRSAKLAVNELAI